MLCPFKNAFNLVSGLPCLGCSGLLTFPLNVLEGFGAVDPLYFGNDGIRETWLRGTSESGNGKSGVSQLNLFLGYVILLER